MKRFLVIAAAMIASSAGFGWALAAWQNETDGTIAAIEHILALPSCEIHQAQRERLARSPQDQAEAAKLRHAALKTVFPVAVPVNTPAPPVPGAAPAAFPIDLTASFDLIDHHGRRKTQDDFLGRTYAIFFGYASCEAICSAVLPDVAGAMEILGQEGHDVDVLMVTVDPDRDTPAAMRANLPKWHEGLTGLTGTQEALAAMREAFQVQTTEVGRDDNGGPIYAHGSLIYLIGADGKLKTILPPVYAPDHLASVIKTYLPPA